MKLETAISLTIGGATALLCAAAVIGIATAQTAQPPVKFVTDGNWTIVQNPDPAQKGITVYPGVYRPVVVTNTAQVPFTPYFPGGWLIPGFTENMRGAQWLSVRPDPNGPIANTPPYNIGAAVGLFVVRRVVEYPATCKGDFVLEGRIVGDGPPIFFKINGETTWLNNDYSGLGNRLDATTAYRITKGLRSGVNTVDVGNINNGAAWGLAGWFEGGCRQ